MKVNQVDEGGRTRIKVEVQSEAPKKGSMKKDQDQFSSIARQMKRRKETMMKENQGVEARVGIRSVMNLEVEVQKHASS